MSREIAKSFYTRRPGDPSRGSFVTGQDARDAIDAIYDDIFALSLPFRNNTWHGNW